MATGLPSLELRCLGPPSVRLDGQEPPPDVLWRKHLALLTYLALSPDGTRTRSHLMGLLWPESPEDKARRSLNEAVRTLRAALGAERLVTDGETLQLHRNGVTVDLLEFESLCQDDQLRAVELIRGDFLEGFHVAEAPAFDAWMESQRARVRDAATQLIVARAEEQIAVNRYVEARALARRALALNPYCEPALSLAMRSAALDGDAAGALALYHDFAGRLQLDLGEEPSGALTALAARVREGRWQRHRGRHATAEPPLIGRRDAHAHLFAALEGVPREGPVCLVIAGDTGSGRTRLLDACAERLVLGGSAVATARILESDHDAPWSTLRALMRGGLLDTPGLAATDHVGLCVLASVVPELAGRVTAIEARDVAQVADALASLLRAVAEEEPVALLIDDAQWGDHQTLAALRTVWSRERNAPQALVLTIQTGPDPAAELQALVASLGREIPGAPIRLEPFTTDEIGTLTEAMAPWCRDQTERDRLARRVAHESGGNPFLAVTLLRDLAQVAPQEDRLNWPGPGGTFESTMPITIPGVVRTAIVARAARLDADSLAALRAASVAGEVLDPPLIAEVTGLSGARVEAAIDQLERERFVVFDGARYAFKGRLLPAVIARECILPGGRRRIREQLIAALAAHDGIDSQLLRARLLLAAERHTEAFDTALGVVERALALEAARTASSAMRIAERAAGTDAQRLAALEPWRTRTMRSAPAPPP